MYSVNENYLKLPGSYLFSNIAKKVAAFSAANPNAPIIRLGIGDVTQPLAPAIIEALHSAVDEMAHAETFHGYAPDLGYEFLRSAIAKNDFQARGCDIAADEIFISDGAKSDSGNIQEIFGPDCRIAVGDPVYPVYVDTNVMAGRTGTYDPKTETWSNVIYMPCTAENGFVPELPKEVPDMIYLCFPNNPTGAVMTREDLEAIAEVIIRHDIYVLSDEIYSELTYAGDHVSIASLPGMKERTITMNGFSKAYAMTGWRLGYACGPREIIKQMTKVHQFAIMCAPTNSQYAAVEALRNGDDDVIKMRESYNGRRRYLLHAFAEMGLPCFEPLGAFYAFPCIKEFGMTSDEFASRLLKEEKVAVVPGSAFGECGEGYLRISYAYSLEDLKKALDRMADFVKRLKEEGSR
mgnify:CR=1 FL=1